MVELVLQPHWTTSSAPTSSGLLPTSPTSSSPSSVIQRWLLKIRVNNYHSMSMNILCFDEQCIKCICIRSAWLSSRPALWSLLLIVPSCWLLFFLVDCYGLFVDHSFLLTAITFYHPLCRHVVICITDKVLHILWLILHPLCWCLLLLPLLTVTLYFLMVRVWTCRVNPQIVVLAFHVYKHLFILGWSYLTWDTFVLTVIMSSTLWSCDELKCDRVIKDVIVWLRHEITPQTFV